MTLVALSDTHGTERPRLTDHLRSVIDDAATVVHAGDFTTMAVLEAFGRRADLRAVHGNRDSPAVRERLPETRTVEWADTRFAVAHGHRRDWTGLSLLGRQERVDAVIVGHTHRPSVGERGGMVAVNPGSHADPRGSHAAYALFERDEGGVVGQLRTANGDPLETLEL